MLRRILTILAIVVSLGTVAVSVTKLREHIQGIIAQREKNAEDRDREKGRANKAETNLKNTSNTLVRTGNELMSTSNELVTTRGNLETTTAALDKSKQDLEKSRDAEKAARQTLSKWEQLGGIQPEEVKAMKDDLGKAKEAVLALQEETSMLGRKVRALTNELRIYREPDYSPPGPIGLKGSILVVDPKWDFVILDIGEKQSVVKGGIMLVHRGGKLIGKVRITNVMADRSIANIMPGWKLEDIQEGDKVLF